MAARIIQLLKDPALRRRMGGAGSRGRGALFTVERMVEETAAAYDTAGRHSPFSGHCESPCARLNPQAFIMPTWHSEKS